MPSNSDTSGNEPENQGQDVPFSTDDLENATTKDLPEDIKVTTSSEDLRAPSNDADLPLNLSTDDWIAYRREEHQVQKLDEEIRTLRQRNGLRGKYFILASCLASFVILASTLGIGYYLWQAGKEADTAVLITWLIAVVVEILGIMKIMAKYLFANQESDESST